MRREHGMGRVRPSVDRRVSGRSPEGAGPLGRVGVGALLLVSACAGGSSGAFDSGSGMTILTGDGTSYTVERSAEMRLDQEVPRSPAEAWSALPGIYGALGMEPDLRVDSRRQLGASQQRFSGQILNRRASDFFDCGTDPGLMRPLADQAPIDARVITTILAGEGGSARVRTEVSGSARRTGGTAGRADCRSTGLLELLIARMVEERAG